MVTRREAASPPWEVARREAVDPPGGADPQTLVPLGWLGTGRRAARPRTTRGWLESTRPFRPPSGPPGGPPGGPPDGGGGGGEAPGLHGWLPENHPLLAVLTQLANISHRQMVASEEQSASQKRPDQLTSQAPTRIPKNFGKFTGDVDKVLNAYKRWEE